MPRIVVARKAELLTGLSTPGILREKAFEAEVVLFSRSTVGGGVVSDWHHHGEGHLYGFLTSGHLRLEFGPKGNRRSSCTRGTSSTSLLGSYTGT